MGLIGNNAKATTMGKTGPDRTVTDTRLLIEFVIRPEPAFFPAEFEDELNLSVQQIRNRLAMLEDDGYVRSKKVSQRLMYWITDKGRDYTCEAIREEFQNG